MADSLLTLEELATRWYLKPITLDQWRWNGKGPRHLKIGRKIFYRIKDVEAYEEKKARNNTCFIGEDYNFDHILEAQLTEQRRVKRQTKKHL